MSEHFKEGALKTLAGKVMRIAIPLLKRNLLGVLSTTTGLTLEIERGEQDERNLIEEYLGQRAVKDELKGLLAKMSEKVVEETGHPMIFIIDELDRCRPTFAIELLERVKHIFDVPNLVFVFGINRDELCKSLQSIYGDIDSDVYLRRFFDMEFTLPEVDSAIFCRHLMEKFELASFFSDLNKNANGISHDEDFEYLIRTVSTFWGHLGLSLRDIDYCVRTLALVGKNLKERYSLIPRLLGPLIPLKLMNRAMYREFIQGNILASDVMNYIDERVHNQKSDLGGNHTLNLIEVYLYFADRNDGRSKPIAWDQLLLKADSKELTHPEYISNRTQQAPKERIQQLLRIMKELIDRMCDIFQPSFPTGSVDYVAELIDLHQQLIRR